MNTAEKIDVEALMHRIREEIRETLEQQPEELPRYVPKRAEEQEGAVSPILYSEELNYLNANWHNWHSMTEFSSHRKFIGPVIVRIKRFFMNTIWTAFMRDYVERERQYQSHLVRFLNSTARYIDARDKEIFWQLVKKIDYDLGETNDRTDRLVNEVDSTLRSVELSLSRRLASLESGAEVLRNQGEGLQGELVRIDEIIRGLERTLALLGRSEARPQRVDDKTIAPFDGGVEYLLLENRFRGSEELIKSRMTDYVDDFSGAKLPVLDIGCGRGELLELLRDRGVVARGLDLDQAMVTSSKAKGLDVQYGEARGYLTGIPDASLGGLIATQVVEHLKKEELEQFIELSIRKVAPGGKIIFETINPQSVIALARNFFRDPTHVWPIHPDTLRFVMEMKGVKTTEVRYRAQYPKEATLQTISPAEHLPERWNSTLGQINRNIERLNELLFGYQDYCVVGVVPASAK